MATATGTATSFTDLYAKLRDFLTTNATLVGLGQNWQVISGPASGALTFTDNLVLQGPGLSGTDEILVTLEPSVSVGGDYYNLGIGGLSSYNPGDPISGQANRLTPRYLHLWNTSMPYWFIANGRRFIVVVRISTVYQSAYAGFILPYHLPTTWAYPLFIGACSDESTWRYSVVNNGDHAAFFNPGQYGSAIRLPDGVWLSLSNKRQISNETTDDINNIAPWASYFGNASRRDGLDGGYKPYPAEIVITTPYACTLGALQGVFHVPGFGTASENTFVADGVTHLVVQNVYRTSNNEYAALALE
jgi:hypothetical protein